jgi:DNA-binding LacI/PurR family transcriptional regulator
MAKTTRPAAGRGVTLQDIADAAGVSRATVSLVLNEKKGIAEATRQRTLAAASRLGYVLPDRPRRLPPTVSVLIERLPTAPMADPFNRNILVGIESAARQAGYRIALEFVGSDEQVEPGRWLHGWTRGVIILGGGDLGSDWVREATVSGLPVVMVDHVVPDIPVPAVVPDNYAGAIRMTQYLIDRGHTRIGFIRGPSKYWTLSERLAGYMLAMQQAGLGPDPALIPPRVSHGDEKGRGEMAALLALPEPPTAVFAVSDLTAMGAYRAATEHGLRIPNDISIVGFDDIDAARSLAPPLTTVRNPGDAMGALAFARLMRMIDDTDGDGTVPTKWTLPTTLVERASARSLEDGDAK